VQVNDSEELNSSTELLSRLLLRRHEEVKDYEITVPELLLKQEQRTKDIFNIVLGAIASISLLVGASDHEYHVRLGDGTDQRDRDPAGHWRQEKDIVVQFLASCADQCYRGLIGVIIGLWLPC